jgi:hypothetical protein
MLLCAITFAAWLRSCWSRSRAALIACSISTSGSFISSMRSPNSVFR